MNHTLVTFLGRARVDPETGYRRARYRFPGAPTPRETPFFGMALAGHLTPDAAVILGTSGSQWSVLVEHLAQGAEAEDVRLELLDAETQATITQPMLDHVTPLMSRAVGLPVTPRLIPFGQDADEQYEILGAIADTVPNGDVSFDLTHGFRHLGMVGFLSAFMLQRVRNLHVRGLWYGALDMTDRTSGITPVLRLDGLTRVRGWVDALDRFDATGDYGVFAPLLIEDGVAQDKAGCLKRAAFFERAQNLLDAARQLRTFLPILDTPLSGASGLFQKRLAERLRWVKAGGLADYQRKLAFEHLKRHDFLRAAVFGWEALCTLECERRGLRSDDYATGRKLATDDLDDEIRAGKHPEWKKSAFLVLRDIRNALAHGNPPGHQRSRQVLQDPDRLRSELEKAFQRLLERER
jgi:CRISPR-associated Csx2 family protein